MVTKHAIVLIITSILVVLIYSCSDESAVSTLPTEADNAAVVQIKGSATADVDINPRDTRVYVYAVTEEERIVAHTTYSSVTDIDFPLTVRQVEMIENGEFVEIKDQRWVSLIVTISYGEELYSHESLICKVGILSGEKNIDTDDWSCIKCCAADIESCCCKKDKDEGRLE